MKATYKSKQIEFAIKRLEEAIIERKDRMEIAQLASDALLVGARRKQVEKMMAAYEVM